MKNSVDKLQLGDRLVGGNDVSEVVQIIDDYYCVISTVYGYQFIGHKHPRLLDGPERWGRWIVVKSKSNNFKSFYERLSS